MTRVEHIERRIFMIRGQKVMMDRDLAQLYAVPTKVLNQAVKRNIERFPEDFMFQLSDEETDTWWKHVMASRLRSQFVTL
ncbi:MAG: ORF6N domain-containing protein, partial [Bacteroidota bacterium]